MLTFPVQLLRSLGAKSFEKKMIGISYQKIFFIIYRRRMARNFWLTTKLQLIPFDSSTIRMICSIFSTHHKLTFGKNTVHLSCQFHLKNAGKCCLGWENTIQKTSKPTHEYNIFNYSKCCSYRLFHSLLLLFLLYLDSKCDVKNDLRSKRHKTCKEMYSGAR